jgi:mono/diheme cytochrome c family protein
MGLIAVVLISCTGTIQSGAPTTSSSSTTLATPPVELQLPGESEGAFVFRTHCATCHGAAGEGELGPPLQGIVNRMTEIDQIAAVKGGSGRMPAFASSLSDDEIRSVVDYTRTQLPESTPSSDP